MQINIPDLSVGDELGDFNVHLRNGSTYPISIKYLFNDKLLLDNDRTRILISNEIARQICIEVADGNICPIFMTDELRSEYYRWNSTSWTDPFDQSNIDD